MGNIISNDLEVFMFNMVFNTQLGANIAHRRMEANFIRYRAAVYFSLGFSRLLRNRNNELIDVDLLNDDDLINNNQFVLPGFRNGILSQIGGTERWSIGPEQRQTDGKYLVPVPDPGVFRDTLLDGIIQRTIE